MLATIIDQLNLVIWHLAKCPGSAPAKVRRPGDLEARRQARAKARTVRKRISETKWKEA